MPEKMGRICTHPVKVYENMIYLTHPPQKRWICKTCLHIGTEYLNYKAHPNCDEFDKLYRRRLQLQDNFKKELRKNDISN